MANADVAYGLRPVKYANGAPYNGAAIRCFAADGSNNLFVGDAVKRTGTGSTDATAPAVVRSTAGAGIFGVIVGIESDANGDLTRDTARYVASGVGAYVMVCPAEDMVFSAQEDSTGGALATTDIGRTVDIAYGTASTTHPIISAGELDSSTAATTSASMNLSLVAVDRGVDNDLGTNARWLVKVNNFDNAEV